jgi:PPM family protein phosphatase
MKWWGATDTGRRRPNNEDAWVVDGALNAAILADGMGGENCGEVGSAITVETIVKYLRSPEPDLTQEELAKEAIREANREVIATAQKRRECDGMGSTVVLVLWCPGKIVVANVGDSRAYLYRGNELRQMTYDQNFANELRQQLGLSEERVRALPNGNVLTMAIGTFDHVLIRTHIEETQPGDQILICSDGLHGPVNHATIARILGESGELRQKVERLIDCANQFGGPDNVTVVLLECSNG